jgi:hypothetical protein
MTARLPLAIALAGAALAAGGCGARSVSQPPANAGTSVDTPSTLPAGAVPYLPSSVKTLSARVLAREAAAPALVSELGSWGYVTGADRYFQGESRDLQLVDSRTLRFRASMGASAFVEFVRGHAAAYLGSVAAIKRFASRGRSGIIVIAQPCQCHLSNPAFLGVVSRGSTVTWLEINGPAATPRRLAKLIADAP